MSDLHLEVSIDDQELVVIRNGQAERRFPVSTAAKGAGFDPGSHRTPTGHFRVAEKIGADAPVGTIFRGRQPHGTWDGTATADDLILTRILWLEGLDEPNRNTRERYIYLHGTNHEDRLGQPCSCGCVRLANADIVELFELVPPGTRLTIHPPTRHRGKLIFFDCDSTLSTIEGIDELARARGPEVFAQVEELTHAAMNGEVPIHEVFPRRMEIIRPDRKVCEEVAQLYVRTITEGTRELIDRLRGDGWMPVILSGGFEPLIRPLADQLGVRHVEAVPLYFDDSGAYSGYDGDYPTTRNGGKPEIIRQWKRAMLPQRVIMVGDGISDLEARSEVDLFVGYGGVVTRPAVKQGADRWIDQMSEFGSDALT